MLYVQCCCHPQDSLTDRRAYSTVRTGHGNTGCAYRTTQTPSYGQLPVNEPDSLTFFVSQMNSCPIFQGARQ